MPISDSVSSATAPGLHFVVSTRADKFNPQMRKLIRSHVMLGKNRGKTIKRGTRNRGAEVQAVDLLPPSPVRSVETSSVTPESESDVTPVLAAPRKFGSEFSTIQFADHLEPGTIDVVLQCKLFHAMCPKNLRCGFPVHQLTRRFVWATIVSSIAKQILFPLESCIFFTKRAESWIAPLAFDPAYLHAMIFSSQWYFDTLRTRDASTSAISSRAMSHYQKTLKILRNRFAQDDDHIMISGTTAAAVMSLAAHAFVTNDVKASQNHITGLYTIVGLKGGINTFKRTNAKLLIEILR